MMPVTVFVAPGPLVTSTAAGLPVARAYPSASCAAFCSCRTSTNFIFRRTLYSASNSGIAEPPGNPNMISIPIFSRLWISASAPFIWFSLIFRLQIGNYHNLDAKISLLDDNARKIYHI